MKHYMLNKRSLPQETIDEIIRLTKEHCHKIDAIARELRVSPSAVGKYGAPFRKRKQR